MNDMDIAMIDPSLFTGRYNASLCSALADLGNRVTLYGRPFRPTDAIEPTNYLYRPDYYRLSEAIRGPARKFVKPFEHMVAAISGRSDPKHHDIVHYQWLPLAMLDALSIRRIRQRSPVVLTVHNIDPFHGDGLHARIQGMGQGAAIRACDALIVHTDEARVQLIDCGHSDASIAVIPHPPMRLKSDPNVTVPIPQRGCPRILFMGTIRPYKGVDILLDAAVRMWRIGLDFELAIVGQPYCDIEVPMAGARNIAGDRLIYDPGFHSEPHLDAHLQAADILVFPYRAIEASGAVLSSLHYGKPIIVSDIAGFASLKEYSAMFASEDADGLASVLQRVLEQPGLREVLGQKAIEAEASIPNWDDVAKLTMNLYREAGRTWLARCAATKGGR